MHDIAQAIFDTYVRKNRDTPRTYLGASSVGRALGCKRQAYLAFRHASPEVFDGRMLKLFETGHREEDRIIRDIMSAGFEFYGAADGNGTAQQLRVSAFNGLFKGHADGLVRKPGGPWLLFECKTASKKRFAELAPKKADTPPLLQDVRPVHYAQMQVYMGLLQTQWPDDIDGAPPVQALYLAICKDDERMHTDIVDFDPAYFDKLGWLVREILTAESMPDLAWKTPDYKHCTYCASSGICWDKLDPAAVCGTCDHFRVDVAAGAFRCGLRNAWGESKTWPHLSCKHYRKHADFDAGETVSFWS